MKPTLPILLLLALTPLVHAFEYQAPESAVFDPQTQCYYVSNYRGSSIARVDKNGNPEEFITDLSMPLGLVTSQDTLYAIDSPRWVKGFNLTSGEETFSIEIPESQFLNDLTTDNHGIIYATDSQAGHIYRIDSATGEFEMLVDDVIPGVNGILYDPSKDRLVACRFNTPSSIIEIYPNDPKIHVLYDKKMLNLDGITTDLEGNFYISTWGPGDFGSGFEPGAGLIYKFEPTFTAAPSVAFKGYDGPADISFNPHNNEMLIPQFLSNGFSIIKIKSQEIHTLPLL